MFIIIYEHVLTYKHETKTFFKILKLFCLLSMSFVASEAIINLKISHDNNHHGKIEVEDARRVVKTAGCIVTNSILMMNIMTVRPSYYNQLQRTSALIRTLWEVPQ